MKKILFYYPSNKRSVVNETLILAIRELGHDIQLLTTCKAGDLHYILAEKGIECHTAPVKSKTSLFYYLKNILFLAQFCRKHHIDFVFSNLQHVNFIAVFAQYLMKSKVIVFRHHFKFNKGHFGIPLEVNRTEVLFDKVINRLARKIIVPSSGVYNGMKEYENVKMDKVSIISYPYDFSRYGSADLDTVQSIKTKYPARLRLIMVARLIPFKRHLQLLPTYNKLIKEGLDIKVLILDEGPCRKQISDYISENKLENNIFLIGYTAQFLEYMKASDLLIHPSLTEASNNVVKEMGLMKKAVAVCKGVGDFDDYIVSEKNGFLMNIEQPEKDAERIIRTVYEQPELIQKLGENLNQSILRKFGDNKPIMQLYSNLIND